MDKRIFTYWVNPPGGSIPSYLQLCLQTWYEQIPDLDLVIINHENIHEWTGGLIDMDRFIRLPLPMQKDVVEMLVLKKHGGIFMDVDTIVTKDIFESIASMDARKLIAFGYPNTCDIHLAIFISLAPDNKFISAAAKVALERLNKLPLKSPHRIGWDHFGNSIFEQVWDEEKHKDCLDVLDRTETGNILESHYFTEQASNLQYFNFYFAPNDIEISDVIPKIVFGAISLHNSWTPDVYKSYNLEEVIASDTMLSTIIRYALADFLFE